MDVAAVQFRGDREDLDGRRASLARWIWGLGPGVDLVVCPELAVSGYVFQHPGEAILVAEDPDGPTCATLAPLARALGTWIVCGFVERAHDRLFNSALVLDPAGERRFVYRKTLLYELDESWASPGDSGYRIFDTDAGDFAVGICMDINDPGFTDWLGAARPTALAFPTNWLDEGMDVRNYWAWRLTGTGTALVAANTWGIERGVAFRGHSAILQPRPQPADGPPWWLLATASAEGDQILRARLR
jgi:N-carbamoylputrescine amidase